MTLRGKRRIKHGAQDREDNDYADLQLLLAGTEGYGTVVFDELPAPEESAPERDAYFYSPAIAESGMLVLKPGEFVYFAPGELHKPCCASGGSSSVGKAVFKIRC